MSYGINQNGWEKFKCVKCGKGFGEFEKLKEHMQEHRRIEK